MFGIAVSGMPILVTRMKGKFYAMDAICSHLYAYLPRGQLSGNIVTCPFHDAKYDVTTGKVVENVAEMATVAEP